MIAIAKPSPIASTTTITSDSHNEEASCHDEFLSLLPAIRHQARAAFRFKDADAVEDAISEVSAYAWIAFRRLAQLGRLNLAYPSALARFGVSRVRDGRRVGCRANVRDPLSPWCRRRKGVRIESLDRADERDDAWQLVLVEDHRTGPAAIATMKIDFEAWLQSLPCRQREIAEALAAGHGTGLVACMFRVSPGRIGQLRKVLHQTWCRFQGEVPAVKLPSLACR
jgi:hypothetical protein